MRHQLIQEKCSRCKNTNRTYGKKLDGTSNKTCDRCIAQTGLYHKINRDKTREWNKKSRVKRGHLWCKKPEQILNKKEYNKDYWEKNKDKLKPINKKRAWGWYKTVGKIRLQKPQYRYKTYKASSRRSGRIFDISYDLFFELINSECYYCGDINNLGLDRVDNDIGYIESNIVPCCKICNLMKRVLPKDIFIDKCLQVAKKNGLLDTH